MAANRPIQSQNKKFQENLPRPYELECKTDFINRVLNNPYIKSSYTPIRARIAAEREWSRAKDRSIISVTTSVDQFLMF